MCESRRTWVVALMVLAGVSIGVDGAWSMEQEWCFHENCKGTGDPIVVKTTVPPGSIDDLGFDFTLEFAATFPPQSRLTFLRAIDASDEFVFELTAFGDLLGQTILLLTYRSTEDAEQSLILGPMGAITEEIEVSREVINGVGAITVRQGQITYETGFTPLYGDPVTILQGLLEFVLEPYGRMWMTPPMFQEE